MKYDKKDKQHKESKEKHYDNLQSIIKSELNDAEDYIGQVGKERAESTEYYLGNEPDGTSDLQSEFVSTDVRDSILFMLPSIMRTFFGTKKVVEFLPTGPEDIT